jgi:hypothetical protein
MKWACIPTTAMTCASRLACGAGGLEQTGPPAGQLSSQLTTHAEAQAEAWVVFFSISGKSQALDAA